MQEETQIQEQERWAEEHPWLAQEEEDGVDSVLRFSLDEIRF